MKINQLKLGSILSYTQMALGILIGLLYTPVMLRCLGQSEYGLYSTVSSAISMMSILNLGFSASYIRYYAKYKKANDLENIYRINALFFTIFAVIAAVCMACGLYLSFHLELIFKTGLTQAEYEIAHVLTILMTCNFSLIFLSSVFNSIITAHEKFVFLKSVNILKSVVAHAVNYLVLMAGYRSIAMVSVTLTISIIADLLCAFYAFGPLKQKIHFGKCEKGIVASLFSFTFFIALNLIVDQVNWNIGKLLLARYCGTAQVAVYAVGYTLYNYYMTFSTSISGVFIPRVHKVYHNYANDSVSLRKEFTSLFTKVGRIQFLLLGLLASGLVFFGRTFITELWAGKDYATSYYVMLLLVLSSSIALIQNIGIEIQRALNLHKFRSIVYIAMAAINLATTFVLCRRYGAIGTGVGTAFSLVIANGLIMNIYYHKKCSIDILAFWRSILRILLGLLPAFVFGWIFTHFYTANTLLKFAVGVAVYSAVYLVSAYLLSMNEYEKNLLRSVLKIFRRRIKR